MDPIKPNRFTGKNNAFLHLMTAGIALTLTACVFLSAAPQPPGTPTALPELPAVRPLATLLVIPTASGPVEMPAPSPTTPAGQPMPAVGATGAASPVIPTRAAVPATAVPPTNSSDNGSTTPVTKTPAIKGLTLSERFTVPDFYQVDYPKGWLLSQNGDWEDICQDASKTACFHAQIQNTNEDSLGAFMASEYQAFIASVSSYRQIKREELMLNGISTVVIEQSYILNNTTRQGFAAYLVKGGVGYIIQAEIVEQAASDQNSQVYVTLRNMVNSFQALTVKDARSG